MAVRQEAVVANTMEAIRQDVEEKATNELADFQAHDLALVTTPFAVRLPAKGHVGRIERKQAAVGDRNPMGIAREISQDLFGTHKGLVGIDEPFACAQRQQRVRKCSGLVEGSEIAKELQFASSEDRCQTFEK